MITACRSIWRTHLALAAFTAVLTGTALVRPQRLVHADMFFSEDDPVVRINGVGVHITLGVATTGVSHIRGHVPVLIVVPDGTQAAVVSSTPQSFAEDVTIASGAAAARALRTRLQDDNDQGSSLPRPADDTVVVFARVAAAGTYPTLLAADQAPQPVYGHTNQVLVLQFPLPGHTPTGEPAGERSQGP
jgi:hypothetical protein